MRLHAGLTLAVALAAPGGRAAQHHPDRDRDQQILRLVEREGQVANLLAAGKLAFDAGDYATASARWTALLELKDVPADVERAVRPLLTEARSKSGLKPLPELGDTGGDEEGQQEAAPKPRKPAEVTVSGTVAGGGTVGPGGAVISLYRVKGWTPKPAPLDRPLLQKDKAFVPHVLAVPVGSEVDFRNEDPIFHNVFSLSPAAHFDTGLHKGGDSVPVKFDKPGAIELLCNIHASMLGYLVVVDTPWYAVADGSGSFQIKDVPPGEYEARVWHESASHLLKKRVTIAEGTRLAFTVAGDKRQNPFPPDKYGKPRQQQLGY